LVLKLAVAVIVIAALNVVYASNLLPDSQFGIPVINPTNSVSTANNSSNTTEFLSAKGPADNLAEPDAGFMDVSGSSAPEPGTFALMGLALAGFSLLLRARSRRG